METQTVQKKAGNPLLTKKPKPNTFHRFKLLNSYDYAKPVDAESDETASNPYPHTYIAVNSGVAWDPSKGELRQWRYVFGYNSIWVEDQNKPVPTTVQLMSEKNDIIFKNGFLRVPAQDVARLKALELNDAYAGNSNPVNEIPKVFELIDDAAATKKLRSLSDLAFEAESEARNCPVHELMPIAQLYGIDTEQDEDMVRTMLIFKSRENPEKFLENFSDPKPKLKYLVTEGVKQGFITTTDNKVIYLESGNTLFEVNSAGDVAEQIANMVIKDHKEAVKLLDRLQQNLG